MSAQTYEALADEIDRIVKSPYPTQLRTLRDLLCITCTEHDISRWILSKPCQVDRLARCILDGLRQWPYVLEIVTKISHNTKGRDTLLHHEPTLVRDIILRAIQTDDPSSQYAAAAVTILSHPLPMDIALPSEVQTLFVQLFDHAAREPSVTTIMPIYRILQGTSTLLPAVLSGNVLFRFENHLFAILRNLKGDNPSLSLYCLAIMRILASCSNDHFTELSTSSYDTQELLASTELTASTKWTPETVQQYFTEKKAQKTIQLVVLRVMWACTPTTGESYNEKMESLVLANEIIAAVPVFERETWRTANALVPKKFEDKVFAPSLEPRLRFQALCFLVRLAGDSNIPTAVLDGLRQIVTKMDRIMEASLDFDSQSAGCLPHCGIFDQNTTTVFLQNTVDFIASANPENLVEKSGLLVKVLRQLRMPGTYQEAVIEGSLLALDVLSCGSKLRSLARLVRSLRVGLNDHSQSDMCVSALRSAQNALIHELCGLFLRAALSGTDQSCSISQDTLSLLLDLYSSSAQTIPGCFHMRPANAIAHPTTHLSFVEAESTPEDTPVDWRQALRSQLSIRAIFEHENLATLFAKSCAELERRCNEVEEPLREAQAQRDALQEKYDKLQQTYEALESDNIDRNVQFNALESERDQYLTDLDALGADNDHLGDRCRKLEQRLLHAENSAANNMNERQQAMEAAALEHSTALARKEEELEDLQAQVQEFGDERETRKQELERVQNELGETKDNLESTRQEMQRINQTSQEQQVNVDRLTSERDSLLKNNEQLEAQITSTRAELNHQQQAHRASVRRQENEASQNLAAVESSHKQELIDLAAEHDQILQGLKRKLSDIEDESHRLQEHHASEIEQRDFQIAEKQKKLERLNRRCEQKDRQIAEANAMRSNLMAAMGLSHRPNLVALPHRPLRSSTAQTSEENQEDPSPPTPFSGDDADMQQPGFEQSISSNLSSNESRSGPTPKRPRPKRPSAELPRSRTSTTLRSGRSISRRQPLLKIDANPSIRKGSAPKTPSNVKLGDLDETTFDGSDLFAGTPRERVLGLQDALDENS